MSHHHHDAHNHWSRRWFLQLAAGMPSAALALTARSKGEESAEPGSAEQLLHQACMFGDWFVEWQSPGGAPDPEKCPYRSPGIFNAFHMHGCGPMTRALYRLFDETGDARYKATADRYALFLINCLHDPLEPYTNRINLKDKTKTALCTSWMYGKALSPCYEEFCRHNPKEDAFELKAHALYRWLQTHRREEGYIGVGYPLGDVSDAQFSCDLGEVGNGLVGFYQTSGHEPALKDAIGLASYFLSDYQEGSGRGVWSEKLGVWLVGPWPGTGAEHHSDQSFNRTGWGWSAYIDADYLLRLHALIDDEKMKSAIADKCVKAFRWCMDACQFEDGAHGMFGRDDKWVGMGAAAILLYTALLDAGVWPAELEKQYRPKIEKTWRWLVNHTGEKTFPTDGYIRVTGKTNKSPLENLVWLMSWTCDALLAGKKVFLA